MIDEKTCSNCPSPDHNGEWYHFLAWNFDAQKARTLITPDREVFELTEKSLRALMLPLDPPEGWKVGADGKRYMTMNCGAGINEKHLAHIPEDKLDEPCIILPFRSWSKREKNDIATHIMIDGSHRAVRLFREGKKVTTYVLTEQEAVSVCMNREPHLWKGIKTPKPRKPRTKITLQDATV